MRTHTFLAALALVTGLGVVNLQAQHDEPAATQAKGKMAQMGKMGQMADHMSEMMGGHREVAQLVDKLAQSFAAIQAEKDPAALAAKLTAHAALLKELQTKVQASAAMMEKMEKEEAAAPATPASPAAPAAPPVHQH